MQNLCIFSEPADTGTNLENGTTTSPSPSQKKGGKKTKSSKKSKLSLAEKLLVKLEKGVDLLKGDKLKYAHFVQVADMWLIKHGKKLKDLFIITDEDAAGVINYDVMKSGM